MFQHLLNIYILRGSYCMNSMKLSQVALHSASAPCKKELISTWYSIYKNVQW